VAGCFDQAVEPTVLVRMSASINGGSGVLGHGTVITRMMWEPSSYSLLFLGCDGKREPSVVSRQRARS
jgi:hypothetical protein